VDGVDTNAVQVSYGTTPSRRAYSPRLQGYADIDLIDPTVWRSQSHLEPVKKVGATKAMGILDITSTTTYTYEGDYGTPLSVGKAWAYEQQVASSIGGTTARSWSVKWSGWRRYLCRRGHSTATR